MGAMAGILAEGGLEEGEVCCGSGRKSSWGGRGRGKGRATGTVSDFSAGGLVGSTSTSRPVPLDAFYHAELLSDS